MQRRNRLSKLEQRKVELDQIILNTSKLKQKTSNYSNNLEALRKDKTITTRKYKENKASTFNGKTPSSWIKHYSDRLNYYKQEKVKVENEIRDIKAKQQLSSNIGLTLVVLLFLAMVITTAPMLENSNLDLEDLLGLSIDESVIDTPEPTPEPQAETPEQAQEAPVPDAPGPPTESEEEASTEEVVTTDEPTEEIATTGVPAEDIATANPVPNENANPPPTQEEPVNETPTEEPPTNETVEPTNETTPPSNETVQPTNETTPPTNETVEPTNETTPPSNETVQSIFV